jgi:hypothetical protein
MTPVEKGAYCRSCASTITDFTGMSDRELADYLSDRKDQKICGRFLNSQLNRPIDIVSPEVLWMDIPAWKKYLAILFICFSGFLTGCSSSSLDFEYPLPETVQLSPRNVQLESLNCKQEKNMPGTNTGKDDIDNKQENTQIIVLGNVHTDHIKDLFTEVQPSVIEQIFRPSKK